MKILIAGATGQLGRHVVSAALRANHRVVAFARRPEKLQISDPSLQLHAGNILNSKDVTAAVAGCDAVIVTIGTGMSRKNTVRSVGTQNVVDAMQNHDVRRLICQSTLGAQESWDNLNFYWKHIMFGALIRPIFKDHEEQERIVQASDLNWTIVRPSAFKDKPGKGHYHIDIAPSMRNLKLTIAKSEIADFLISQLDDATYMKRAVGISR